MKSLLWHIGDTGQDVGQPGARINAVQLGSLDQCQRRLKSDLISGWVPVET